MGHMIPVSPNSVACEIEIGTVQLNEATNVHFLRVLDIQGALSFPPFRLPLVLENPAENIR